MSDNANFSISEAARRRIAERCLVAGKQFGKIAIPAIGWLDSELNNGSLPSMPVIGFYFDRNEIDRLTVIDGLECAYGVPPQFRHHFEGKTLDYDQEHGLYLR